MNRDDGKPTWINPTVVQGPRDDTMSCKKCGLSWFELVEVHQYSQYHNVVLGQRPPTKLDNGGFYVLRCPKCQELYEPNVHSTLHEPSRKAYEAFLDALEAPIPGTEPKKI